MPADLDAGIAATKLRPPASPTRLVERTRLDAMLDAGISRSMPLLLISAPAGSGKSTMIASWASRQPSPVAWLQLEAGDSDPATFWMSMSAAIGRCRPALAAIVGPLVSGASGDDRVIVPTLVNALVDQDDALAIVIDDYHLIDDANVHRGMERLIDLCPAQLTVVISTRFDPPFRLGRMRVRDRVTEVRADELRFGLAEATELLGAAASALSTQRLDDLCARTEGWAAGLVLAGLSLQRAPDPDRFVDAFRGDDQLVVAYLSDELLDTMGAGDRTRLLETAVLEHLTGPLVDAVTGSSNGTAWLAEIADRNQLVIRLDSTGEWFRYHHLLRDLLLLEARRVIPDRLAELNGRAATWFESRGEHDRAVTHRLAADDIPAAVTLMRFVGPDLLGRGQVRTLRSLLELLGPAANADAACAMAWGWCEYLSSQYASAQRWLDIAMSVAPPGFDPIVAMPLRINVALGRGDVATALEFAQLVTATDDLGNRPAELGSAVGGAYTWAGASDDARNALTIAIGRSKAEHRFTAHVLSLVYLAITEIEQGFHAAAHAAAVEAISTAETFGIAGYHAVAPAFAIRGRTALDVATIRRDIDRAMELVRRAQTDLGLAYVLTMCGDSLLDLGDDAGAQMLVEARSRVDRCIDPGIASRALARAESRHHLSTQPMVQTASSPEQLTERELAVLRYLPSGLSQRDIAAQLYVSLNTVKTHCAAIFRKLDVADRKSAVQAARNLHLL